MHLLTLQRHNAASCFNRLGTLQALRLPANGKPEAYENTAPIWDGAASRALFRKASADLQRGRPMTYLLYLRAVPV